ncbi:hypothetical protein, partial [Kitasatospora indigofera]|uniref:hypothetical protein n=1 Tax=Kitasatospora indigofera TaxID=67307 RepID=UPI0036A3D2C8
MNERGRGAGWTLRAQLVAGTAAILGVALLAVIIIGGMSLNSTVTAVVDGQLTASFSAFEHSVDKYRGKSSRDPELVTAQEQAKGFTKPLTEFSGQATGTVIAIVQNGAVIDAARFSDGDSSTLSGAAEQAVADAAADGEGTSERELGELGRYRIDVQPKEEGEYLVTAIPLTITDEAEARQASVNLLVALLALAVAVISAAILAKLLFRSLERGVDVAETVI